MSFSFLLLHPLFPDLATIQHHICYCSTMLIALQVFDEIARSLVIAPIMAPALLRRFYLSPKPPDMSAAPTPSLNLSSSPSLIDLYSRYCYSTYTHYVFDEMRELDAASSSIMNVSCFDTCPYDPGPFGSHPHNLIKLGFLESKMDGAVTWRQDSQANLWLKEPYMINPNFIVELALAMGALLLKGNGAQISYMEEQEMGKALLTSVLISGIPISSLLAFLNQNPGNFGVVSEHYDSIFVTKSYYIWPNDLSNVRPLNETATASLVAISFVIAYLLLNLLPLTNEEGVIIVAPIYSMKKEVSTELNLINAFLCHEEGFIFVVNSEFKVPISTRGASFIEGTIIDVSHPFDSCGFHLQICENVGKENHFGSLIVDLAAVTTTTIGLDGGPNLRKIGHVMDLLICREGEKFLVAFANLIYLSQYLCFHGLIFWVSICDLVWNDIIIGRKTNEQRGVVLELFKYQPNMNIGRVNSQIGNSIHLGLGLVSFASLAMGSMLSKYNSYSQDLIFYLKLELAATLFVGYFESSLEYKIHNIAIIGEVLKGPNPPSSNMLYFKGNHFAIAIKFELVTGILFLIEGIAIGRIFDAHIANGVAIHAIRYLFIDGKEFFLLYVYDVPLVPTDFASSHRYQCFILKDPYQELST